MKLLIKYIIRKVPREKLQKISTVLSWILPLLLKGNNVVCPICGDGFRKFLPYGTGIMYRKNAICPKCFSLERHRLLWLFLKNKTDFFNKHHKILHVAPEQCFYKIFRKKFAGANYITADLNSPLAQEKVDIQQTNYQDNQFDVIICNHVMEHVENDFKAMKELFRILQPNGFAIIQVPIDSNRKTTFEDPSITKPVEREKHYWRKDHLRLYGRDYSEKLKRAGFKVSSINYLKELENNLKSLYKLPKQEIIYLCHKY